MNADTAVAIPADEFETAAIERADSPTGAAASSSQRPPHGYSTQAAIRRCSTGPALLASEQDHSGGYEAGTFFIAPADHGQMSEFFSRSFTTALALEAMARFVLAR